MRRAPAESQSIGGHKVGVSCEGGLARSCQLGCKPATCMAVGSSGVGSPGRRSVTLFSSTWSWRVDPSPTDGGGLGRSGAEAEAEAETETET